MNVLLELLMMDSSDEQELKTNLLQIRECAYIFEIFIKLKH